MTTDSAGNLDLPPQFWEQLRQEYTKLRQGAEERAEEVPPLSVRAEALAALQRVLVDRIREWHNRQRLSFVFDPSKSTWQIVREILDRAREADKEGPVGQYLVGAKLQLLYPDVVVENFSYSTSDPQRGRSGDFLVGDTVFHVTVSPMANLFEKCQENLADQRRVYLIVPDRVLVGTRQNAEALEPGGIFVKSIEAFVGGNVDELSTFSRDNIIRQFRLLVTMYNQRVDAVETDKSMLIEVPPTLASAT